MKTAGIGTAFVVTCALLACGGGDEDPAARASQAITRDQQLLYTLDAGTEWIGAVGRDAQSRATSAAARTYAATLAADHQGVARALADAAQRAELSPAESGLGVELVGAAQSARTALQSMTGAAFDLAFVESAIRLQQQLLSAVDRDVAALQNPALRQIAEQTRPTLEAHILRGRQLLPELRLAEAMGTPSATAVSRTTTPDVTPSDATPSSATAPAPDTSGDGTQSRPTAPPPTPTPPDTTREGML